MFRARLPGLVDTAPPPRADCDFEHFNNSDAGSMFIARLLQFLPNCSRRSKPERRLFLLAIALGGRFNRHHTRAQINTMYLLISPAWNLQLRFNIRPTTTVDAVVDHKLLPMR